MNILPKLSKDTLNTEIDIFYQKCNSAIENRLNEMEIFPELAIITSGGAFRGAWILGVVHELLEIGFREDDFKFVLGPSASSGTLSYFVSKQLEIGSNIWLNGLADNEAFLLKDARIKMIKSLIRKKVLSIRKTKIPYYEENTTNILNPSVLIELFSKDKVLDNGDIVGVELDFDSFVSSETTIIIPVRNNSNGESKYYTNHEGIENATQIMNWEQLKSIFDATMSVPLLTNGSVVIEDDENQTLQYGDGSFADPLPLFHDTLVNQYNCLDENILPIVILPGNVFRPDSQIVRSIVKQSINILDKHNRGTIIDKSAEIYSPKYLAMLKNLALEGKIILIFNTGEEIDQLDNSREVIRRSYEMGMLEAGDNIVLKTLFSNVTQTKT